MSFNLTAQKWIPVVDSAQRRQELSLIELFQTWHQWQDIQADNPPTTLALYRFLLAILHRVYQGPHDPDHWEEIHQDNGQQVITYLQEQAPCFDLLHAENPFMQDPALSADKAVPIYLLHTMSTTNVFCHKHEWSGYSLSLAETARMLVRLQSVDITSLRAFYPQQTKGNRSAVNTPPINAANVLIQSTSLQQTLLFNLMQYSPEDETPSSLTGEDLPAWETSYAGKPQKVSPHGYISYLAYPWRRLRVFFTADSADRINITMGNSLPDKVSPSLWECGIAYDDGKPLRLSLERQLWRNAHSFLYSAKKSKRPEILTWLAELRQAQLCQEDLAKDIVRFNVFGMCANQAKPLGWAIEQFAAPTLYLIEEQLAQALSKAIAIAESHQQVFRSFRGSPYYALTEVLKHNDAASLAKSLDGESRYWATLDRKFQDLLSDELPRDKTDIGGTTVYGNKALPLWTATVQKAAEDAFTASILSIRNYEARAKALRTLAYHLRKLRGEDDPSDKKKKSSKARKSGKAA